MDNTFFQFGKVVAPAGASEVGITFPNTFAAVPDLQHATIGTTGISILEYRDVTAETCVVVLSAAVTGDTQVSWMAGVKDVMTETLSAHFVDSAEDLEESSPLATDYVLAIDTHEGNDRLVRFELKTLESAASVQAGVQAIGEGVGSVDITFDTPYSEPPVVIITFATSSSTLIQGLVTDVTPTSFHVELSALAPANASLHWEAAEAV